MKKVVATTVLIVSAVGMLTAQGAVEYSQAQAAAQSSEASTGQTQVQNLSVDEGILHMREEEKLARDVYLTLYERWGIRTFAQIARSEQRHIDAVAALMQYQGIQDPTADLAVGEFTLPEMQQLYDDLVAKGSESAIEALTVGAIIEDLDIYDLQQLLNGSDDPLVVQVYSSLLRGSENHMRSFAGLLDRFDAPYTPSYISQTDFDTIMNP